MRPPTQTGLRFIIEFDGVLMDMDACWYAGHAAVAAAVGWSTMDEPRFRRLTRKEGKTATILPGAKPVKIADYQQKFEAHTESDDALKAYALHEEIAGVITKLAALGSCVLVTTGSNLSARKTLLEKSGLSRHFERMETLNTDPRRRPAELRMLAGDHRRPIVVSSSESIIRAAGAAELFAVGVTSGMCGPNRLHQAGADAVYRALEELQEELATGGSQLIQAGLPPAPLG